MKDWEFVHICYQDDFFSYLVSFGQAVPPFLTIALTGISFYRRDLTMVFVIWIAWIIGYFVSYGISQWTGIRRPEGYYCDTNLAFPDQEFVSSISTLFTFVFITFGVRLHVFLSTNFWFFIITAFYIFSVLWNRQLNIAQVMFSLGMSLAIANLVGNVYCIAVHPFKLVFMKTKLAGWLGFTDSL